MRAIVTNRLGGIGGLQVVTRPDLAPGPGQVRISVAAAGINQEDLHAGELAGRSASIAGSECAGRVTALGTGVPKEWHGARVMALVPHGAHADQVLVPVRALMPVPEQFSFEQAAVLPRAFLVAADALFERAGLLPSEPLLVIGATPLAEAAAALGVAAGNDVRAWPLGNGTESPPDLSVVFDDGSSRTNVPWSVLGEKGRWIVANAGSPAVDWQNLGVLQQDVLGTGAPKSWREITRMTRRFLRTQYSTFTDGRIAVQTPDVVDPRRPVETWPPSDANRSARLVYRFDDA